jgi:hypothetical protein
MNFAAGLMVARVNGGPSIDNDIHVSRGAYKHVHGLVSLLARD